MVHGWSADTAERGLRTLADLGLLTIEKRIKKAPLSPTGLTVENVYTLQGPYEKKAGTPPGPNTGKQKTVKKATTKKALRKKAAVRAGT